MLKEVCETVELSNHGEQTVEIASNMFDDKVQCTYFGHSKEVQDKLEPLHIAFKSSLYRTQLGSKGKEVLRMTNDKASLSTTEFATLVWNPVCKDLNKFGDALVKGTITLEKIEKHLGYLRLETEETFKKDMIQVRQTYPGVHLVKENGHDFCWSRKLINHIQKQGNILQKSQYIC